MEMTTSNDIFPGVLRPCKLGISQNLRPGQIQRHPPSQGTQGDRKGWPNSRQQAWPKRSRKTARQLYPGMHDENRSVIGWKIGGRNRKNSAPEPWRSKKSREEEMEQANSEIQALGMTSILSSFSSIDMSDLNQNQFCSYRLDFHVIMNASSLTGDLDR
jgi:hypothetical protein